MRVKVSSVQFCAFFFAFFMDPSCQANYYSLQKKFYSFKFESYRFEADFLNRYQGQGQQGFSCIVLGQECQTQILESRSIDFCVFPLLTPSSSHKNDDLNWDAFNKNECLRHFVQSLTAAVSSYSNYYLLKLLFRMYYFSMTYCFALIRFNGQLKQQKTLTVTETIRVSASLVSAHILQALFFLIVKSLPRLLIQGTRCMMVF